MRRLCACVCAAVVSMCVSGLAQVPQGAPQPGAPARPPATGPARDATLKATGTAIIRGRVVTADTGRPLRKTQVRLLGAEVRESRLASTDLDGRYEFKDLPTGRFQLTASKAGYAQLQYGQLRAFEGGRPIDLKDGQTTENINFALPRGAVITGRVLDELGDPVVDVQVSAMRYQFIQGRRRLAATGRTAATNDIGEFRLFGLLPGQYYVSASLRESLLDSVSALASGIVSATSDTRSGYASTYYPGTTRAADAQKVTLAVGQTLTEIQIPLSPIKTARVAGTVLNSEGRLVTTGSVIVVAKDDPSMTSMVPAQIQSDGSFTVAGLSPADYRLLSVGGNPLAGSIEISAAEITVTGDDITGVQLHGVKPVTVTGRITADVPANTIPLATMNVIAIAANPDDLAVGSAGPSTVNAADQTFELKVQPGRVLFRLGGAPGAFVIRTVRVGGEDITETGFDFKPNTDVSNVEIEVTNKPTTLTGAVTDSKGQPSKDYVVVVFTQDRERWTPTTRMINISRPDQEGRFRVRVPGGNYFVAAVDYLEPGEQFDQEFLGKLRDASAVTFTIASGETKTMDLRQVEHP